MINKVILIGRLTADPRNFASKNNLEIARFSLAINSFANGKQKADYISCVSFGKVAENILKYTKKGQLLYAEGMIKTNSYVDNNNEKKYSVDIVINNVRFLNNTNSTTTNSFSNSTSMTNRKPLTEKNSLKEKIINDVKDDDDEEIVFAEDIDWGEN